MKSHATSQSPLLDTPHTPRYPIGDSVLELGEHLLYVLIRDELSSAHSGENGDAVARLEYWSRPFQPTVRQIGEHAAHALMLHAG